MGKEAVVLLPCGLRGRLFCDDNMRQRRPSRAFPTLHWHRVGQRSKNMCLCFCSVNGANMTHQKHVGQMFVVMRCHFYTVTFLNTATF